MYTHSIDYRAIDFSCRLQPLGYTNKIKIKVRLGCCICNWRLHWVKCLNGLSCPDQFRQDRRKLLALSSDLPASQSYHYILLTPILLHLIRVHTQTLLASVGVRQILLHNLCDRRWSTFGFIQTLISQFCLHLNCFSAWRCERQASPCYCTIPNISYYGRPCFPEIETQSGTPQQHSNTPTSHLSQNLVLAPLDWAAVYIPVDIVWRQLVCLTDCWTEGCHYTLSHKWVQSRPCQKNKLLSFYWSLFSLPTPQEKAPLKKLNCHSGSEGGVN